MFVNAFKIFVDVHSLFHPLGRGETTLNHDFRTTEHTTFRHCTLGFGTAPDVFCEDGYKHEIGVQCDVNDRDRVGCSRRVYQTPPPGENRLGLGVPFDLFLFDALVSIAYREKAAVLLDLDLIRFMRAGLVAIALILPIHGKSVALLCAEVFQNGLPFRSNREAWHTTNSENDRDQAHSNPSIRVCSSHNHNGSASSEDVRSNVRSTEVRSIKGTRRSPRLLSQNKNNAVSQNTIILRVTILAA